MPVTTPLPPTPAAPPRLLTRSEVAARASISVAHLDRLRRRAEAPAPASDSLTGRGRSRVLRWSAETVDAWIDQGMPPMESFRAPGGSAKGSSGGRR